MYLEVPPAISFDVSPDHAILQILPVVSVKFAPGTAVYVLP